jgi:hypothetical protein
MSRIACSTKLAVLALAGSILIAPVAYAKHASFEMPACDKLLEGDGRNTAPAAAPVAAPQGSKKSHSKDLTPMKLTDEKDSYSVGEDGKMKLEVQQNNEVQEGKSDSKDPTATSSVVGNDEKLKAKLLKDSQKVNVAPIALQETEGEAQQKENTISDAEKAQLSDLWTATINRSPDIQFVINKLQPNSDGGSHTTATALKLIGGALFNIVQVAPLMMPGGANMGTYMLTGSSASILQGLVSEQGAKSAKKQQISQEQATMLYKIVRDTAEKVVVEYRKYRQTRSEFQHANEDLEDLKAMVAAASGRNDPAKAIEMEYTIRKAQRDVEKIIDEAKMHKQQLVDLAGGDAVGRLDTQMDDEAIALQKLVGSDKEGIARQDDTPKAPSVLDKPLMPSPIRTATDPKKPTM